MKRILGVMGSPRRGGNTHTLMKRMAEGVLDRGGQMDIVELKGLTVEECEGCHVCWQAKPCSREDDMNPIYERIIESDAIVLGTPVYWYGPTALMKAFMDRFVYFNCEDNRVHIAGKPVALVIPYEETDPDTAAPVVDFFERALAYLQMPIAGKVMAPGVTKRGEVRHRDGLMAEAFALGQTLAQEAGAP